MQAVADAALGAHALHEVGIAHTNITPSNILLGTRCAKLADPSLLAVLDPGRTTAGTRAGNSVDLTDPSILLGVSPSRASDVWSLGATLHRMLTGQSLFGVVPDVGETEALRHVIVAPARLGGSLSPSEARVIAECVAEDPVERPLTAEALADATALAVAGGLIRWPCPPFASTTCSSPWCPVRGSSRASARSRCSRCRVAVAPRSISCSPPVAPLGMHASTSPVRSSSTSSTRSSANACLRALRSACSRHRPKVSRSSSAERWR